MRIDLIKWYLKLSMHLLIYFSSAVLKLHEWFLVLQAARDVTMLLELALDCSYCAFLPWKRSISLRMAVTNAYVLSHYRRLLIKLRSVLDDEPITIDCQCILRIFFNVVIKQVCFYAISYMKYIHKCTSFASHLAILCMLCLSADTLVSALASAWEHYSLTCTNAFQKRTFTSNDNCYGKAKQRFVSNEPDQNTSRNAANPSYPNSYLPVSSATLSVPSKI